MKYIPASDVHEEQIHAIINEQLLWRHYMQLIYWLSLILMLL